LDENGECIMTVYEATEKPQFLKIGRFLEEQPKDQYPWTCWATRNECLTGEDLELFLSLNPDFHCFYVEDDNREIRAVVLTRRTTKPRYTWTHGHLILDYEDFAARNLKYLGEMLRWIRDTYPEVEAAELWGVKEHVDFFKEICGEDVVEIVTEAEDRVFGTSIWFIVDVVKWRQRK